MPYEALEPNIDTETMHIHHDKHHAAYVNNLNAALKEHPDLQAKSPEQLDQRPRQRPGGHPYGGSQQRRRRMSTTRSSGN